MIIQSFLVLKTINFSGKHKKRHNHSGNFQLKEWEIMHFQRKRGCIRCERNF